MRPSTDAALMLGLAHTLVAEGLHDRAFLDRCTVGFDRFEAYLLGREDGQAKDADWAAAITGMDAGRIRALARETAAGRTMLSVSWSLQRTDHGEQPYWLAIALAAMLGQVGLPGGGFGFGYAAVNGVGHQARPFPWPALPQGRNPVESLIPVARISDMLLHPGEPFDFDGRRLDLPRHPARVLGRRQPVPPPPGPEPAGAGLEAARDRGRERDVLERAGQARRRRAAGHHPLRARRPRLHAARRPPGRDAPARRPGRRGPGRLRDLRRASPSAWGPGEAFTEGRSAGDWLRWLYTVARQRAAERDIDMPEFAEFWAEGVFRLPPRADPEILMAGFRADPAGAALRTPSGRIEIFSETIASFGYDDCPGHPAWLEPAEWLGSPLAARYPLAPGLEPAGRQAAQPARPRAPLRGGPDRRPGGAAPPPRRRGGARHRRRATWCGCSTTAAPAWPRRG